MIVTPLRIRSIGTRIVVTAVTIFNADIALDVCTEGYYFHCIFD